MLNIDNFKDFINIIGTLNHTPLLHNKANLLEEIAS